MAIQDAMIEKLAISPKIVDMASSYVK
jgi:hypothetical protein